MSSYSKDLYKQIILEHYDFPNNKVDILENKNKYKSYHSKSESCIDDFEIFIKIENDVIIDVKFIGVGCAISTSSTDILCSNILKKTLIEAQTIINEYKKMIDNIEYDREILNEAIAFENIYKQQNRIKCALVGYDSITNLIKDMNK